MCLFKKKKDTKNTTREDIAKDKDIIAANTLAFEGLKVLARGNDELIARLERMQDKTKYLNPSVSDRVIKVDEKIGNALGDLKIQLNKGADKSDKVDKLLNDVELLMSERDIANI